MKIPPSFPFHIWPFQILYPTHRLKYTHAMSVKDLFCIGSVQLFGIQKTYASVNQHLTAKQPPKNNKVSSIYFEEHNFCMSLFVIPV